MKIIKQEIAWFIAISFPLTYSIGIYFWNKGGIENSWSRLAMYSPAFVVLILYLFIFRKPIFKKGDLGLTFSGWKYWFIAPLLITLLSVSSYAISYLFNPEMFSSIETIKNSLDTKGFYWGNIYSGIVVIFLLNGIIGSIINLPMFIGEELGWRGFLLPRLLVLMKPRFAFITGGAIWALWHLVMIAEGLNYPDHFISGIGMMVLLAIPLGIIIQYFYFKSKSIFVAALTHAALNKSAMSMTFLLEKGKYNTLLYGPTGIIGIALFFLVAIYLYNKIQWNEENTFHKVNF